MKELINLVKEMQENLISLENLMNQEYNLLSKSKTNIEKIELIIEKKEFFLRKIASLKEKKLFLEKKYSIFPPYFQFNELNQCWNEFFSKCCLLKKKNIKNKMILNQKFYLNQRFLNIFQTYRSNKNNTTYDIDGNLEN
ncbi:flagellar biosynthesis protein FlgN [Buchnera aphidicola (Rhopalosiphum padi)]|uniref:Flagellar biosynthesis protein FlgN n=1 Tax=Buchnera aphidicola subsp. Rhopalosiphum padi TaxID=98793 RepID=A0A4D6YGU3_BUCRP|nr:flagellar export chaperone FlgN [Buchnera aphidicola]QCI24970.1 flagellar biosynthesis protein FlgN [Buchnera aphidicola (Rhopalosiphum padi)]